MVKAIKLLTGAEAVKNAEQTVPTAIRQRFATLRQFNKPHSREIIGRV